MCMLCVSHTSYVPCFTVTGEFYLCCSGSSASLTLNVSVDVSLDEAREGMYSKVSELVTILLEENLKCLLKLPENANFMRAIILGSSLSDDMMAVEVPCFVIFQFIIMRFKCTRHAVVEGSG